MYENRKYLIFKIDEIDLIDFNYIIKKSIDKLRISINGTKSFIKWDGDNPNFINNLSYKEGPYTHSQILSILENSVDWVKPNIEEEIEEV